MRNIDRNDDIYKVIDEIADYLATLTKEERIAWFRKNMYLEPLNFVKEIDGTLYAVRTFFKKDATENITEKVERIILKK
mgnify:CR=1 FL=1